MAESQKQAWPTYQEPLGTLLLRRSLTVPAVLIGAVICTTLCLPAVALAGLYDLVRWNRGVTVRALATVQLSFTWHVLGLALVGTAWLCKPFVSRDTYSEITLSMEIFWSSSVVAITRWLWNMGHDVEGAELLEGGSLIVFPRHVSIVDTLLPIIYVAGNRRMHLRYVMKAELLWDPVVDVLGHREPTAFVHRGRKDVTPEIDAVRRLCEDMRENDAAVIFPEGTRFTQKRFERRIVWLENNDTMALKRAYALKTTLPPKLAGAFAMLETDPKSDVIFMAHVGLEGAKLISDFFAGSLLDRKLSVKFWRCPRSEVPTDYDARRQWMYDWWLKLDAWVAERTNMRASKPVSSRPPPHDPHAMEAAS